MLQAFECGAGRRVAADAKAAPDGLAGIYWLDLADPTPDEFAFASRATGLTLPSEADVVEIEN